MCSSFISIVWVSPRTLGKRGELYSSPRGSVEGTSGLKEIWKLLSSLIVKEGELTNQQKSKYALLGNRAGNLLVTIMYKTRYMWYEQIGRFWLELVCGKGERAEHLYLGLWRRVSLRWYLRCFFPNQMVQFSYPLAGAWLVLEMLSVHLFLCFSHIYCLFKTVVMSS